MSQVAHAELRLVEVIREAREFSANLTALRNELRQQYDELPKAAKKANEDILEVLRKADELIARLKKETHEANETAHHIEKHYLWKRTVEALFGVDGLQRCFDYMTEQQKAQTP